MTDSKDQYVMTIGGKSVGGDTQIDAFNPATKEVIASFPDARREQLDEAVRSAREAFRDWSVTPLSERQRAVAAIGEVLTEHAEELMALLTREQGKPRAGAEWEIFGSADWCAEVSKQSLPDELVEETDDRRVITRFSPLGVVGGITPWNFPILLAIWKIAPPLVAGNCMVLKPSPFTPLTTLKLGELCQSVLPPGVLNVVSGGDDLGKWMTGHPGINKIAFTGHTETGKHVMRSAADNLKRLTLELGGNDPAIVLPDVDPEAVAPELFWGAFQNNAQFCNSIKRLYIHEDVYDAVRDALVEFAKGIRVGNGADEGTDIGPIQNLPQYEKVIDFFDDCAANEHTFALGGAVDRGAGGWFIPITLVDDPPENSRIVQEEPFGPILPLLKWSDEEDVIQRANDTRYGLGASVWGRDLDAVQRIGSRLDAGTVWLNEIHQYSPHQAFGGHKESGIGCENSLHGMMEYTNWHTITLNKSWGRG
jgi:acyl-CoA reductase-like NAD-dependent aldehyde dehydrogenase